MWPHGTGRGAGQRNELMELREAGVGKQCECKEINTALPPIERGRQGKGLRPEKVAIHLELSTLNGAL